MKSSPSGATGPIEPGFFLPYARPSAICTSGLNDQAVKTCSFAGRGAFVFYCLPSVPPTGRVRVREDNENRGLMTGCSGTMP